MKHLNGVEVHGKPSMYEDEFQTPQKTPIKNDNFRNDKHTEDIKEMLQKNMIPKSPWLGSEKSSVKTEKEPIKMIMVP